MKDQSEVNGDSPKRCRLFGEALRRCDRYDVLEVALSCQSNNVDELESRLRKLETRKSTMDYDIVGEENLSPRGTRP